MTRGRAKSPIRRWQTRSKKRETSILLADATFVGETTEPQTWSDQGYRLYRAGGVLERRYGSPTCAGGHLSDAPVALGHNFLSLDADGPVRHVVPFVRSGDRAMPSLGLAAALRVSGVKAVGRPRRRPLPDVRRSDDAARDA